jgi:hypothetical protein
MLIKSLHHDHFFTDQSFVYEKITSDSGSRDEVVFKLNCYYPNHEKLTQPMVDYLNKYLEMFPPEHPESNEQLALF